MKNVTDHPLTMRHLLLCPDCCTPDSEPRCEGCGTTMDKADAGCPAAPSGTHVFKVPR